MARPGERHAARVRGPGLLHPRRRVPGDLRPRRCPGARPLGPLPPACSSPTRSTATSARRWFAKRSTRSPRCEMTPARESGSPRAPATLALGAALTLAGLAFGLAAALVAGIALFALALGAIAWVELATLGGRLERTPGPTRLEESDPYPLRLGLRRTLVPPPGGELSDPLLDRPIPVGPRWRRGASRDIWLERPGRLALVPAQLVVRDPLGLWRRELDSGHTAELVVLPRIDPVRWIGPGSEPRGIAAGSGSNADATSRRGGLAQFEVDGLRPYRQGSPASRIHWPAVARTGEMIERRPDRRGGAQAAGCLRSARLLGPRPARAGDARRRLALRRAGAVGRLRAAGPGRAAPARDRSVPAHLARGAHQDRRLRSRYAGRSCRRA